MFQLMQGGPGINNSEVIASANLAGMHYGCHIYTFFYSNLTHFTWIIDSGTSQHITFERSLLHNVLELACPVLVILSNSYKVKVFYVGSLYLTPDFGLHNVLLVPAFKHNLLSVSQLCTQFDYMPLF